MGRKRKSAPEAAEAPEPVELTVSISLPVAVARRLEKLAAQRGTSISELVRVASHNLMRRSSFYDLGTRVGFGKYHEETMETVIRCDPGYVSWCSRNMEKFELSAECLALLEHVESAGRHG